MRIQSKRFSIPFRNTLNTQTTVPLSFPYEARLFYNISFSIQKFWWTCLMKNLPATFACWRLTHENKTRNISGAPSAYGWGFGLAVWYNTSSLPLHSCGTFFSVRMIWRVIGSYWHAWQLNQTSKLTFCFFVELFTCIGFEDGSRKIWWGTMFCILSSCFIRLRLVIPAIIARRANSRVHSRNALRNW